MKKSWLEANIWLGIELAAWLRLLARNRFAIHPARLPMAALITAAAAVNTNLRVTQWLRHSRKVARVPVPDDPIFIVGHWRTGTTMLHELLALDPRMRAPSTYESLSPNHFLVTERFVRRFGSWMLPRTRPFDNMRVSYDRPQEDEVALALRGVPSPFLSVAFPRRPCPYPKYVDLDDLSPRELAKWQAGFRAFLQLLLFRRPGRLVLKSPQHTTRVPVLAQMFPGARFIYMTRDPYVVFPSTVHFWRTMYEHYGLQGRVDGVPLREQVFNDFAHMYDRWEHARPLIPADRVYELRYERLAANPLAELEKLYALQNLGDFAPIRPAVAQYAERSRRYQTNEYPDLDAATRDEISRRWASYFLRHGYAK
jgi:omega-hydroxy-beta-dihydromenaquinone-9 sulfotransferase